MRRKPAKAKNELRNKSIARKLVIGRKVLRAIAQLLDFIDISGTVSKMATAHANLWESARKADALESALSAERKKMRQLEEKFNQKYRHVVNKVNTYGGGNPARIRRTGVSFWFPGKGNRKVPKKITGLKALHGKERGSILLRWRYGERLLMYTIWISIDPDNPDGWTRLTMTTVTKKLISGLIPGQQYWFRVSGMWTKTGPPSDPVGIIAP